MRKFNLYLSDEQRRDLDRLAEQTDLSLSDHIRRAIDKYLADGQLVDRYLRKQHESRRSKKP